MDSFEANSISNETLLGFLLGALDAPTMSKVAQRIAESEELQERLLELQQRLMPFADAEDDPPIPEGLAERTLDAIAAVSHEESADPTASPDPVSAPLRPLAAQEGLSRTERQGWWDFAGTALGVAICIGLLLPALMQSREQARREQCSRNLAQLGFSLSQFASLSPQRHLPQIALQGPMSFAGSYALQLNDAGILDDAGQLWCPSLGGLWLVQGSLPSESAMKKASDHFQSYWQQLAGGSYAYNLGYWSEGVYSAPRLDGRANYAILADSPLEDEGRDQWMVHGGRGINILFEDGQVRFVPVLPQLDLPDHPYFNRRGVREAGVDPDDSSLGPSQSPPMRRAGS
ncbi:MAG: hypothetical protein ACK56G_18175 [Pirellulaceae bacterium]